ncbi:phospholipase D family protein [Methylotenera sp.]|uniref:phospholipase D family protein n=1 Tax=Methylotenera sp. TaxID=2051956 RepID=UPI002489AFE2|nr:phospholipase D family protein [Methylotenera sp.]MDI1362700.1 phospholipase D family protein [Methylotenera sp.]
MPKFSVISPLDQPLGKRRLLEDLKKYLQDDDLQSFGFSVAFAKIGPLYRLMDCIQKWRSKGKDITAIFGIDHNGTSVQALQFALDQFSSVYVTQYRGHSFHPKIYWFKGKTKGIVFIGSNNMTMGGMELNFEAAIELEFELPAEDNEYTETVSMFEALLPQNCVATESLTPELLLQLEADGLLLDETKKRENTTGTKKKFAPPTKPGATLPVKPMSNLPSKIIFGKPLKKKELAIKAEVMKVQADVLDITKPLVPVAGFVIQINPHANGEIFLSTLAISQNPAFFGIPFTGQTTPKKGANLGYPQRDPDPICSIIVYGKKNKVLYINPSYPLNTVLYTRNSEIRVTASPLVQYVPEFSVLLMMPSELPGIDYDMKIFTPESPEYGKWESLCDQKMPSGGKAIARKFGWF